MCYANFLRVGYGDKAKGREGKRASLLAKLFFLSCFLLLFSVLFHA